MAARSLEHYFPNASADFIRINSGGLLSPEPERPQRKPLERHESGKEACAPRLEIRFRIFSRRPTDWDNAAPGIKYLQDGLVAAGILPDDNHRELCGRVECYQVYSEEEERTEIQ